MNATVLGFFKTGFGILFLVAVTTWIRRKYGRKELGSVLATVPNAIPKWPRYLFFILAGARAIEMILDLQRGKTSLGFIEGCFALTFAAMGGAIVVLAKV